MDADPRFDRRTALKLGAAGLLAGLGAGPAAAFGRNPWAKAPAESCILVWLDGGPSHIDTFDLKPEAPADYRGEFQPIATSLDGCQICEHLPQLAKQMHHTALVRSLTSIEGNHDRGSHLYQTGHALAPSLVYPSSGSVLSRLRPSDDSPVPSYISLGGVPQYGRAGYLSSRFDPYAPSSDGRLEIGADQRERYLRRQRVLEQVDRLGTGVTDDARAAFLSEGFELLTDPRALAAFDLGAEPQNVRERYGNHRLGRNLLQARRLTEAGSRFVTVVDPGWDTHEFNFRRLTVEGYPPKLVGLDQAVSALLEDLARTGRLERTLVVMMGEMGRTPKINPAAGRDHGPRANFALLAGGGLRTGQVIGSTDVRGELPVDRPLHAEALLATIYRRLGVDPRAALMTPDGREVRLLAETAEPIAELL